MDGLSCHRARRTGTLWPSAQTAGSPACGASNRTCAESGSRTSWAPSCERSSPSRAPAPPLAVCSDRLLAAGHQTALRVKPISNDDSSPCCLHHSGLQLLLGFTPSVVSGLATTSAPIPQYTCDPPALGVVPWWERLGKVGRPLDPIRGGVAIGLVENLRSCVGEALDRSATTSGTVSLWIALGNPRQFVRVVRRLIRLQASAGARRRQHGSPSPRFPRAASVRRGQLRAASDVGGQGVTRVSG